MGLGLGLVLVRFMFRRTLRDLRELMPYSLDSRLAHVSVQETLAERVAQALVEQSA